MFYVAIAFILLAPLSLDPAFRAANEGDPLHTAWAISWSLHQLVRDPIHLFDSNAFHPYRGSLAFSEHFLTQALSVAPVYWLTGNALLAQNAAVLFALALTGFSTFVLLDHAFGDRDAALVGGVLFAFTSYTLAEVPRAQILSLQWWPLAAVYLHRSLLHGRLRDRAWFGLFFSLQCLSCVYYAFYFSLALLLWAPGLFLWQREKRRVRNLALLAVPVVASLGVVGIAALPYLRLSRRFGYQRELADGIDLLAYVAPPEGTFWARFFTPTVHETVSPHFLGLTTVVLAALALAAILFRLPVKHPAGDAAAFARIALVTGAAAILLGSGPTMYAGDRAIGPGPYVLLYDYLPFVRAFRTPERMTVLVSFSAAVLGAYGAFILLRLVPRPLSRALLIALLVLPPLEHFRSGSPKVSVPTGERTPDVYRWLGESSGDGPVVELPLYPKERFRFFAAYLFYSTYHFKPVVFGRTSFYPPAHGYLEWQLRDFPDPDSLDLLRALGVETLVVHPRLWPEETRAARLRALAAMPHELELLEEFPPLEGEDYHRFGFGSERVYRLRESRRPRADALCSPEDEISPDGWVLRGTGGSGPESAAIDRDPQTSWRTKGQFPGHELEIELGSEETLAAVRLFFGYPYEEFPRHLILAESDLSDTIPYRDDGATKLELLEILLETPAHAAVTLRFEPRRLSELLILVGGIEPDPLLPDWQLRELRLYRSCR